MFPTIKISRSRWWLHTGVKERGGVIPEWQLRTSQATKVCRLRYIFYSSPWAMAIPNVLCYPYVDPEMQVGFVVVARWPGDLERLDHPFHSLAVK